MAPHNSGPCCKLSEVPSCRAAPPGRCLSSSPFSVCPGVAREVQGQRVHSVADGGGGDFAGRSRQMQLPVRGSAPTEVAELLHGKVVGLSEEQELVRLMICFWSAEGPPHLGPQAEEQAPRVHWLAHPSSFYSVVRRPQWGNAVGAETGPDARGSRYGAGRVSGAMPTLNRRHCGPAPFSLPSPGSPFSLLSPGSPLSNPRR